MRRKTHYALLESSGCCALTYGDHFKVSKFLSKWFSDAEADGRSDATGWFMTISFSSRFSKAAIQAVNSILLKKFNLYMHTTPEP